MIDSQFGFNIAKAAIFTLDNLSSSPLENCLEEQAEKKISQAANLEQILMY